MLGIIVKVIFFVNFKGTPELAKELDRVLKIADQVLRFMILREGK